MTFKRMSIGGFNYGQDFFNRNQLKLSDKYGKITNFDFYDNEFFDHIKDDDHENFSCIKYFLLCLSMCHSIFTENTEEKVVYEGSSPDELALINAARYFGFIFKKRLPGNKILIEINGVDHEYTINHFFEYTSDR